MLRVYLSAFHSSSCHVLSCIPHLLDLCHALGYLLHCTCAFWHFIPHLLTLCHMLLPLGISFPIFSLCVRCYYLLAFHSPSSHFVSYVTTFWHFIPYILTLCHTLGFYLLQVYSSSHTLSAWCLPSGISCLIISILSGCCKVFASGEELLKLNASVWLGNVMLDKSLRHLYHHKF